MVYCRSSLKKAKRNKSMIRLILALLYIIPVLILSLILWVISLIVGLFSEEKKELLSLAFVRFAFSSLIIIAGAKVTRIGLENIPTDKAVLYVGNHRSYFDILISGTRLYRPTAYIAKKQFFIPIVNLWMDNLHCLLLDRDDIKQGLKTILTAIDYVKNGRSIFIYPEGTRNRTEAPLLPFKEGSMKISTKSGCPIIPVAVTNSSAVFEDHFPGLRPAKVVIRYGEPIDPASLSKEEVKFIGKYVSEKIEKMLEENEKLL